MKKIIVGIFLAAILVGCSREGTNGNTPLGGTVNDPSGSDKMTPSRAPGSTNFGTGQPHSYESSPTPQRPTNK